MARKTPWIKKFFPSITIKIRVRSRAQKARDRAPKIKAEPKPGFDIASIDTACRYAYIYHCGESKHYGPAHLGIWLPIFRDYKQRYGLDFVLLVRNRGLLDWVREEYPEVTVAYAKGSEHAEIVLGAINNISQVLYSSLTGNNSHLLRYNWIRHVFIGHGDSEKGASCHKVFRAYDEVWTAGQAHMDRLCNAPFDLGALAFRAIGRPQLKALLQCDKSVNAAPPPFTLCPYVGGRGRGEPLFLSPVCAVTTGKTDDTPGYPYGCKTAPFYRVPE